MSKARTPRPWTVTPHGPLQKLEDNLWVVDSPSPALPGAFRRMCVVRREDGDLVFFHAVPVTDEVLSELRAWGRPASLLLGHHEHAVDAHAFREKLGLKAYAPAACAEKVRERVELAGTLQDFRGDATVRAFDTPGTKRGDTTLEVKSGGGARVSLLFSDAIQNSDPAVTPLVFRLLGFAGGPKVTPLFRLAFMSDRAALREALQRWADTPNLARLVPCHGRIVERDAAEALRAAARAL